MNYKSTLLSLIALLVIAMPSGVQAAPKKKAQTSSYYPPKPKDKWELGIGGGFAPLLDNLNPTAHKSFGIGIDARKSLGHTFSIRFGYNFYQLTDKDAANSYTTNAHEVHVEGIVQLGNILFHKENSIWGVYGLAGASALFYQPKVGGVAVYQNVKYHAIINSVGKQGYIVTPTAFVGAGISVKPAKFMSISIEERALFARANNLDGNTKNNDNYVSAILYTQLRLGFFLGGKDRIEPLYWVNPNNYAYKKLNELDADKIAAKLKSDQDGDGVPDYLDQEPDTKAGYPVDAHGVALDSDKDGIVDGEDKEPFSPPGYPVDQYGVAQVPPPACCQNMGSKKEAKGELPSIYFDADKYYINPSDETTLFDVAERLQQNPDAKLVITGNDASTNDRKYNEQLAYNRAVAIENFLVEKYGISRDRFILKYVGEPKAKNATALEKKKSSRADLRFAN
ncbi:MAG TPA: OmpA family protein, partial [Chitinophagales bacterium]